MAAAKKTVYDDLFAELIATVKVPPPLVLTQDITLECPTKKEVAEIFEAQDETVAQKIIFKDDYEKAMELFDGAPVFVWNKFMERWNEHFFGDADRGK